MGTFIDGAWYDDHEFEMIKGVATPKQVKVFGTHDGMGLSGGYATKMIKADGGKAGYSTKEIRPDGGSDGEGEAGQPGGEAPEASEPADAGVDPAKTTGAGTKAKH